MTDHSQDKSTPLMRALLTIPAGTPLYVTPRMHELRNLDYEHRANALYEELRQLPTEELIERAGYKAARQVMVAEIIERELKGEPT